MSWGKERAKSLLVSTVGEAAAERLADMYDQGIGRVETWANPVGRASMRRLRNLKDRYQGKRCFIIGNGPSLRDMDLSVLRDEYTFGLNRIYLMFEKLGFSTTFFVSVNQYVIEQCADEIQALSCTKFLSWRARKAVRLSDGITFIRPARGPRFSKEPTIHGVWEGATVTYVAMQLAYYLGFSKVILIGVDHAFSTSGPAHKLVESTDDDPNHFDPAYFGKGFKWQLPDLETSEIAYRLAKVEYDEAGRIIVDATVGGKLHVFPKVDFETLF